MGPKVARWYSTDLCHGPKSGPLANNRLRIFTSKQVGEKPMTEMPFIFYINLKELTTRKFCIADVTMQHARHAWLFVFTHFFFCFQRPNLQNVYKFGNCVRSQALTNVFFLNYEQERAVVNQSNDIYRIFRECFTKFCIKTPFGCGRK